MDSLELLKVAVSEYVAQIGCCRSQRFAREKMDGAMQTFGCVEYSWHLEEEFDQSLLYLPAAFEYLVARGEQSEQVAEYVGKYCSRWRNRLDAAGLSQATHAQLLSTLCLWTAKYDGDRVFVPSVEDMGTLAGYLCSQPPVISLLNALLEGERHDDVDFRSIFGQYLSAAVSADAHAFIVDLFLRVKCFPSEDLFFRHPVVLAAAFDDKGLQRHLTSAAMLLGQRCSPFHVRCVEQFLGLK